MIRYKSPSQLSIEEFKTPFERDLRPDNRWVKLSNVIPWDDIAHIYCKKMSTKMGAPSKDARVVIGAIIIKHKLNLSDEETVLQIQENPYLQYFLGYSNYDDSAPPFVPELFVSIRKRLGIEEFKEMNDVIIKKAFEKQKNKPKKSDKQGDTNKNEIAKSKSEKIQDTSTNQDHKGKLIFDATVAEQSIKYPNDLELLNDSREISEQLIDELYKQLKLGKKPRTYRIKARKDFLATIKKKRKTRKEIRYSIRKQLNYLKRNFGHIESMLNTADNQNFLLKAMAQRQYWIIQHIFSQQNYMFTNRTNTCKDRITSIHQPHVRPIVRGKQSKKTEFGSKLGVSLCEGYASLDHISWDNYNEGSDLVLHVENYRNRFGYYPEIVLADNIYGSKVNREYLKSLGIKYGGKPLGRPKKITEENKEQIAKERCERKKTYRERIPIEGKFGQGKNGYRLNYIRAKLKDTSESWISSIFFVMNIVNFTKQTEKLKNWLFSQFRNWLIHLKIFLNYKNYLHFLYIGS